MTCAASDQCHDAGTCNPATGACSNPARTDGTTCSDGDACTQADTCQAGTCSGGTAPNCDDRNACTVDSCSPGAGCTNTPGNAGAVCRPAAGVCDAAESCTGTSAACPADTKLADGATCSDGNACTQTDTCQNGTCTGASPVTCAASDQCHDPGTCNPTTGACSNPARTDGTTCSDGDACTQTDTCQGGICAGSNPVTCTTPPAATCTNGTTQRTYNSSGACSAGTCSYTPADTACGASTPFCNGAGTCGECSAGTTQCSGDGVQTCGANGQWGAAAACSAPTPACTNGVCIDPCDPALLGSSYIGCEYYPTVTSNSFLLEGTNFHFAVAISNASNSTTSYTIYKGAATAATGSIAANGVAIVTLPWIAELKAPPGTIKSTNAAGNGAYRLKSDRPVAVYQYNPIEYTSGGTFSYTNDASLLLPTSSWTPNYYVAARNTYSTLPGFYAVVASQDGTTVTLSPGSTGGIVKANVAIGVNANGTGTVALNKGDVLQVLSDVGGGSGPDVSDVTGTKITADKPVQVLGGHDCTQIPFNVGYCDHIEESIFPLETLAKSYLVTPPVISPGVEQKQVVRIIATAPSTALTYAPPQAGAPTTIAAAGQYVDLAPSAASYLVTSNNRLLVVQYMIGQAAPPGTTGDPAMAVTVGVDQYRSSYLFHAPTNYEASYVNITAPTGLAVTLDGAAVPAAAFTAIGATGFSKAQVQLSNAGDGNHRMSAASAFGVSVYGYGQYTSYWYAGGLDLKALPN